MLHRWESNPRIYGPGGVLAAALVTLGLLLGSPGTRDAITDFLSSLPIPAFGRAADNADAPAVVTKLEQVADTRQVAPATEPAATTMQAPPFDEIKLLLNSPSYRTTIDDAAHAGSTDDWLQSTVSRSSVAPSVEQSLASNQSIANPANTTPNTTPDTTITFDDGGLDAGIVTGPATTTASVSASGVAATLKVDVPLIAEEPPTVGVGVALEGPAPAVGITVGTTAVAAPLPPVPVVEEALEPEILAPVIEDLGGLFG